MTYNQQKNKITRTLIKVYTYVAKGDIGHLFFFIMWVQKNDTRVIKIHPKIKQGFIENKNTILEFCLICLICLTKKQTLI